MMMERESPTNVDVLIVGAGLAGLYFAIECHRQGHSPRIIESKNELDLLGDFVGIGTSATRQFKKWPGMAGTYSSIVYRPAMTMHNHDGTFIGGPFELSEESHYRPVPVSRAKLVRALYAYVTGLGIPVMFDKHVVNYYDLDDGTRPYAVTDKGERFEADIVVAADGVGSKVSKAMGGKLVKAVSSGWSVYRVTYPTTILQEDGFLAEQYRFKEGDPDFCQVFMSAEGQMIILVSREMVTWLFTHKDKGEAEETWSMKLNPSHALKTLHDTGLSWDARVLAVIERTPPNSVVDYKISWRDPDSVWTSQPGRIVKIGDAAHAFIPNSTNGATQAMEDGISLAACLRLAGKQKIALATSVHSKLRFERTSCAQKHGFKNRDKWEQDPDSMKKDPFAAAKSVGKWLYEHDAEQYVYDNWEACVSHVTEGAPFWNTNIPPGYKYAPWTMEALMSATENGQRAVDAGDWD